MDSRKAVYSRAGTKGPRLQICYRMEVMEAHIKGTVPRSGSPNLKLPLGALSHGRMLKADVVSTSPTGPWAGPAGPGLVPVVDLLLHSTPPPKLLLPLPTGGHMCHERREEVPGGHGGFVRRRVSDSHKFTVRQVGGNFLYRSF